MSDVGRYRRAYPRLFRHPDFQALSATEQRVVFYLLYGPQTNRIGLYHLSVATAAEDMNVSLDSFRRALTKVAVSFGWMFDAHARVFYIPTWWRWNHPDHDKVLKGNLKDLSELPPCGLVDAFARNLAYLTPELHESFAEAIHIRLPRPTRSQEQDQKQKQEQKQEPALRAADEDKESPETPGKSSEPALKIAREVFKYTSADEMETLIDTFRWLSRSAHPPLECSRTQIVAAISAVRLERRQVTVQ